MAYGVDLTYFAASIVKDCWEGQFYKIKWINRLIISRKNSSEILSVLQREEAELFLVSSIPNKKKVSSETNTNKNKRVHLLQRSGQTAYHWPEKWNQWILYTKQTRYSTFPTHITQNIRHEQVWIRFYETLKNKENFSGYASASAKEERNSMSRRLMTKVEQSACRRRF